MSKWFTKLHVWFLPLVLMAACAEEACDPPARRGERLGHFSAARHTGHRRGRPATRDARPSCCPSTALGGGITTRLIDAVRPVFDPRRIRVGNSYRVVINDDGSLRHFEYHVDNDQFLRVSSRRDGDAFDAELVPYVKERVEIALLGGIDEQHSSLVAALDGAGENVNLAILMADVFSGEIDFNNDLRRGDRFEVPVREVLSRERVCRLWRRRRCGVPQRRTPGSGISFPSPGRRRRAVLRPGRTVGQATVLAVAVPFRAAHHVSASRIGGCIPCSEHTVRTSALTTALRLARR